MLYKLSIVPGWMGVVSEAIDLVGINRVDPREAFKPVDVYDLTSEEANFCIEYFVSLGYDVYRGNNLVNGITLGE